MSVPLLSTHLPFPLFRSGKVRDVYEVDGYLLFVTTDRVSAFDHILPTGIPKKGSILNRISDYWFRKSSQIVRNHMLTANTIDFPECLTPYADQLDGRAMIVIKTNPIDVECVVRGYLAGSAWIEYQQSQTVSGIQMPAGLSLGSKLPTPVFSPAIKNHTGHDVNISYQHLTTIVGENTAALLKEKSIALYTFGATQVLPNGLILADTKFEFGWLNKTLVLIDEALTPDSSRYWDVSEYQIGISPPSFDKQIVRDYLQSIWSEPDPIPGLPDSIMEKVSKRYQEGYKKITGQPYLP